ncbi:MAG TPA: hypothetical protein VFP47_09150, partial [Pyrinomonadaceae bacterium]|nr:hypothetical protein [Pyrinomonadaceae bacterium]
MERLRDRTMNKRTKAASTHLRHLVRRGGATSITSSSAKGERLLMALAYAESGKSAEFEVARV